MIVVAADGAEAHYEFAPHVTNLTMEAHGTGLVITASILGHEVREVRESNRCEHCGRSDLRSTVRVATSYEEAERYGWLVRVAP